ncbi:uncharacterized protein [Montipora capricornis]|uniref:uncharacterized protein isoform X2 n=1 Tax=Montipora capricornis TaxID=246305 RepID=UPI0035F16FCA
MSSHVLPMEIVSQDTTKMPGARVEQESSKLSCFDSLRPTEQNVNENLLRATEKVYTMLLKVMKLFGVYFGDANFDRFSRDTSKSIFSKKQTYASNLYCYSLVAGLWFAFAIPLVCMFYKGPIYLLLQFDMWCLLVALNGTVCMVVLPLTDRTKSRFEKFVSNLCLIQTGSVHLRKVRYKTRCYLIISGLFMVAGIAGIAVLDQVLFMNAGTFNPWNVWHGFRKINLLFLFIGNAFWLLPMIFYCITCLILEELFDDLNTRNLSLDLSALRVEHYKLCKVVELADSLFSPLLLTVFGLCIPFICFALYHIVHLPENEALAFLAVNLFWLLSTSAMLAVVMVFGSRVSDKVHCIQKLKSTFPFSTSDHKEILLFMMYMMDLQGKTKGLSIGGLTVVSVIISYFAVMLSLPS